MEPVMHQTTGALVGVDPAAGFHQRGSQQADVDDVSAVLAELEPSGELGAAAGPYLGFVGETSAQTDPRRGQVFVTTLEGLARCPWRAFVTRLLRVEPAPDALARG